MTNFDNEGNEGNEGKEGKEGDKARPNDLTSSETKFIGVVIFALVTSLIIVVYR